MVVGGDFRVGHEMEGKREAAMFWGEETISLEPLQMKEFSVSIAAGFWL